ncbi:Zn-ribbon domain-containing OB-fold protein [Sphingopyxis sp. MSC1_008]|jgi:uncharacterized OB-fold protein|uniref:Zn-ribbon domain-containing OB-fold protein n=1 Tax=Sphingopyxis sp. MSC1_008 TaxID=2909265 RepID=UPI0020BDDAC8|nr:OB-fold domain-containing protein [Sphingopyxis sp. MSC1_008]
MTGPAPLPPVTAGSLAFRLAVAAIEGRFVLQTCCCCGHRPYPPTEICSVCLSGDLEWRDLEPEGEILAGTAVHSPIETYFHPYVPLPVVLVRLAGGGSLLAFVAPGREVRGRTPIGLRLSAAGAAVFVAGDAHGTQPFGGLSVRHGSDHRLDSPDPVSAAERLTAALIFHGIAHTGRHEMDRSFVEAETGGRTISIRIERTKADL